MLNLNISPLRRTCPSKKNSYIFEINWIGPVDPNVPEPDNLRHHLKSLFGRDEIKCILSNLIKKCDKNNAPGPPPLSTETTARSERNPQPEPNTQHEMPPPASLLVVPSVIETPRPTPKVGFASIHMAGSSFSETSSLTKSLPSQDTTATSSERVTRSVAAVSDSDSVLGDTDDEDEYNLDTSDNFWRTRQLIREMVEEGYYLDEQMVSDGEHEDVLSCPENVDANVDANDFARLLKDCTQFSFSPVTQADTTLLSERNGPQKIYTGPTGLRMGIAKSFSDPFGAFRKAGFTIELIKHWMHNSNR